MNLPKMRQIHLKDTHFIVERKLKLIALSTLAVMGISSALGLNSNLSLKDIKDATVTTRVEANDTVTQNVQDTQVAVKRVKGNIGGVSQDTSKDEKPTAKAVSNDTKHREVQREYEVGKVGSKASSNVTLNQVLKEYKQWHSPLADEVEWVWSESVKRGLNPALVLSVQAYESGWGKSWYCVNHNNCFGFAYTDRGKVYDYDGDEYREVTARVLDQLAKCGDAKKYCYRVKTAQEMSNNGYNTRASWVININKILNQFRAN